MNTVSMHFALPLGRQLFTALRWLGLVALACAGVNAREPEVAELRFDRRFAAAETLATVVRPAWLSHIEQAGGQFLDEPPSWQVAASAAQGTGRLTMHLDRSRIVGDLAATLLFTAAPDSDFALQLFDAEGRVVVVDVLGNLAEVSEALLTDTFILPLSKYPTATRVVLRQIHGPLTVYGAVLYPVATEGPMEEAEVRQLAQRLGDPISPESPLAKSLQAILPAAATSGGAPASATPTVAKTPSSNLAALRQAPAIREVRRFKRQVSVLIEDSHGGSDMHNEFNFGSAQLARILQAQGARVASTRASRGLDLRSGLTREVLNRFDVVIFNGRYNRPGAPAFAAAEVQALTDWVHAGGALLVTCSHAGSGDRQDPSLLSPLIEPFGMRFEGAVVNGRITPQQAPWPTLLRDVPAFIVTHGTPVVAPPDCDAVVRHQGKVILAAKEVGKGRVIAFGGGSTLKNQSLGSKVIHRVHPIAAQSNTDLAMSLSLWLAESASAAPRAGNAAQQASR